MPRTYIQKPGSRSYRNYTTDDLEEAVSKVSENKLSIKQASERYKIPYGTLHNKFHGKHIHKPGGQTVLSDKEEMYLIKAIIKCGDWGFPLSMLDIQMFTKSYLDKKGVQISKFKNNVPGRDWALGFIKRHKDLIAQRISSNISHSRANVSDESIREYFANLTKTLENVPPTHIFNYDESNLTDDPGKKKLLYRRGIKYPEKVMNHSKSSTTIMVCGSASGTLLPPYVVYRSEHLWDTWTQGGPKGSPCCSEPCCSRGTHYNRTNHGWMEAQSFSDWFHSVFLPHSRRLEGRKVLIGDNLASHFSDEVLSTCESENISFVCLPANSTHICQPLDVSFFRPMKMAWRSKLTEWKMKNPRQKAIPRSMFPLLLKETIDKMDKVKSAKENDEGSAVRRNLVSGFEATGISPVNPDKVLRKLPTTEDPEDVGTVINDSLTEFLRENRYGPADRGISRKRKRVPVAPGKSIAGPSTIRDSTSSENEDISLNDHSEKEETDSAEENLKYVKPNLKNLSVGKFVLVKVMSGSRRSTAFQYVTIIQECMGNEFHVMGLKSADSGKCIFKPVEDDVFVIDLSDILAILPEPKAEQSGDRLRYTFEKKIDVREN